METCIPANEKEITSVFEKYKKQQLEPVKGYTPFSYKLKKKKLRKRYKKSLTTEASNSTSCEKEIEPLPMELLEELENPESRSPPKKSKNKKKIVVTSVVVEDSYIPLEAGCTTNFSLARLDKSETLSCASTALDFYKNRLYGKRIARVSADSSIALLKKTQAKKALAKSLV